MDDLLQSRVTKAEFGAVACTGVNVLLVLAMGSLKGRSRARASKSARLTALIFAIIGILLVQLACLYKLCQDITTGHHKFHSVRAPRLSAVVPQPSETAAGATGTAPAVTMSPVTTSPSAPAGGVLEMMERLEKKMEEQKSALNEQKKAADEQKIAADERAANLSKALEEQRKTADERAANLSKALEEQKKVAEEKAANLSKAVDEQVANLRKILEEQRQKIGRLEAQQLHQTETRRVLL
jgi:hypothetical protein